MGVGRESCSMRLAEDEQLLVLVCVVLSLQRWNVNRNHRTN